MLYYFIAFVNFGERMIIRFNELEFKNILSFGAKPTVINFDKGLILISGKNGSGKSTIMDALSFCLYGQPYRKIKIQELINRRNKKGLLVSCKFSIGDDVFKIIRGLKPDITEIYKNDQPLNLLSSKKLNQEELDKIIGINYKLFKQIISLSVNYNEPFLSLGLTEKRDIIEQIFDIRIFADMLKILKKDVADIKIQEQLNQKTLELLTINLTSLRKRLVEANNAKQNFEDNKEKNLKDVEDKIQNKEKEIKEIETEINNINLDLNDIKRIQHEIKSTIELKNNIENDRIKYEISKENYENNIEFLTNNNICPTCNSIIDDSHKEKEISKFKIKIKEDDIKIIEYQNEYKILIEKLLELSNKNSDLLEFKNKKEKLADRLKIYIEHMEEYLKLKEDIINRKFDIDVISLNKELQEKSSEYKIIYKQTKKYKQDLIIKDQVSKILSDSGIKSFLFEKFIPILNLKINEYLQLFNIPIRLEFNNTMDEKIINIGSRDSTSYNAYSEGEKKRIDMAILLSFINMTKLICNWNCNILLIDEILDGALDEDGLNALIVNLNDMAYDSNMNILIISHRVQHNYTDKFKKIIQINKNQNKFSDIEFIDKEAGYV